MTTRWVGLAAAALSLPLLAACGAEDGTTLRVLAASSLTDVFTGLAEQFESDHPGVAVQLSFGASTDLAEQAADGAPADVLATADAESMAAAGSATASHSELFATNTLVLVTPPDDPADISSVDDLGDSDWVRCADEVPCGRIAAAVLEDSGVRAAPVSLEEDVRSALDKVLAGEADAALVYATDATEAGDAVRTVPIDGAEKHGAAYFATTLDQSAHHDLARAWLDRLTTGAGRRALVDAGFGLP